MFPQKTKESPVCRTDVGSSVRTCPRCQAVVLLPPSREWIVGCSRCALGVALTLVPAAAGAEDGTALFLDASSLGCGTSGSVFLAWDRHLQQDVALKVLERSDPESRERFLGEARVLARLRHPRVLALHDVFEVDGRPCLVTEFLDAGSLRRALEIRGKLALPEALGLLGEVLEGLAECHRQGLVHRDLKPDNVLLDSDGRPRLADFGLAASAGGKVARGVLGTPRYMAPEQFEGAQATPASDVYAAACLLFEMLAGRPLFPEEELHALVDAKLRGPARRDLDAPEVPQTLAAVLARALASDPRERPRTAAELAAALAPFAKAAPVPCPGDKPPDLSTVSTPELQRVAAQGSAPAIAELVSRHQQQAWRLAYACLRDANEAQDVVQVGFMRVLRNLGPDRPIAHFGAYLRTTIVRLCQDYLERRRPDYQAQLDEVASPASSLSSRLVREERARATRTAVEQLPAAQRLAVLLRYFDELSTREIARVMALTPKAVERHLARARRALSGLLRD